MSTLSLIVVYTIMRSTKLELRLYLSNVHCVLTHKVIHSSTICVLPSDFEILLKITD